MDPKQEHWEAVYRHKPLESVSWYQPVPETSLAFFQNLALGPDAALIDVGGGDSLLADHWLDLGYRQVSVLDISPTALERARQRLGNQASQVEWICANAAHWTPTRSYDFWHDRAAFHFLTAAEDIQNYLDIATNHIKPGGYLLLGTFSHDGPEKCSGLPVTRYAEADLKALLAPQFECVSCRQPIHQTPSGARQAFLFCLLRKTLG